MEKELIKFLLVRPVKAPSRANKYDAGIDFYVPEFKKDFIDDLISKNESIFNLIIDDLNLSEIFGSDAIEVAHFGFDTHKAEPYFLLFPQQRVMIPSGVKSRMGAPGRALIAGNKSGVATKHGLVFGAQVVDYTYKGEIHLSVINTSDKPVRIYQNMKLLQFMETPVFNSEIVTTPFSYKVDEDVFFMGLENDRGEGGFGSTDNK
jgi:dUTP pyrophosphatase